MGLQDVITTKTADDMLATELSYAQANGLATTSWQSGSVIRTILVVMANVFAIFLQIIIEPIKGGFGDLLSSRGWAKIWAKQMYGVDAVDAEPATGYVTLVNASTSTYALNPGDLVLAHATTGKLYRNDAVLSLAGSSTLTNVAITSVEVGTDSDAAPGAITDIVAPALDGVTVTNPLAVLGAADETVSALVDRSRSKLAALSPAGPKDAYNYVVKTPALSATSTPNTRSTTKADPTTGLITVYAATAGGSPSGGDVAICQDAVEEWAEPWCMTATVVAATTVTVAVTYQIWVRSSLAAADIESAIATALAAYFATIPIGGEIVPPATTGYVYVDSLTIVIAGALVNGTPIGTVRVTVSLPTADTALTVGQVAILGTVTGTVTYL